MSESTLTSPSTIGALQSMLHELYSLLEQINLAAAGAYAGYSGSNPIKLDITKIIATANGIGYVTGSGGTVTQATSKSTGVTLNKACGQITMNNAALASNATAVFVVTNSMVATTDVILPITASGMVSGGSYTVSVGNVGSGAFSLMVKNVTGGSLSEAVVISFVVIKAVTS